MTWPVNPLWDACMDSPYILPSKILKAACACSPSHFADAAPPASDQPQDRPRPTRLTPVSGRTSLPATRGGGLYGDQGSALPTAPASACLLGRGQDGYWGGCHAAAEGGSLGEDTLCLPGYPLHLPISGNRGVSGGARKKGQVGWGESRLVQWWTVG